ncbi:hypothetical protein M1L60_43610 [Actinoplanes sp. TRM 88003]|uniref:Teneurin-like YD-shell domain-containing protein n=1 Tax=Paractinoplanes aksuensis TaxID=2939490 RepID=A0ABT1E2Y4_9ACTN|nr:RHS repeat-associated core domain-containing protein [Actinoplanes aksuensis]MCO8277489.1 hypothetical protein [Actinoplanes aksuensis]
MSHVLVRGALAMTLVVGLASAPAAPARAEPAAPAARLAAQAEPLDRDGEAVRTRAWPIERVEPGALPAPIWPAAGTVGARSATSVTAPVAATVPVEVLDRQTVPAAWRDGLLMRVGGAPARTAARAPARATVSVDYRGFRSAYGGDWASRLRLWQVPECNLTTPDAAGCAATPLRSANDTRAGKVTGTAAGLVALAAGPSGKSGDFAASPLGPSSTWSAGDSSGDFSWSYPMRTPPAIAGPSPDLEVSYASGSVDGRSEATNNQPSWVGEGFDLSPGFIERRYVPCVDDMGDGAINTKKTADLCWRSDNATLSLNGRSTELVWQKDKGWHGRSEDGSKIEKAGGAGNGDDNGEYWKVTGTDGIQYFFGKHTIPGRSGTTDSTWTVPVAGNNTGEPCRDDTFLSSFCDQGWRWNLDYVVDPFGNTMSYWYEKETNKYAQNVTESGDVPYVRGGYPVRIDYGTWDRGAADRSVTPTAQVVFTTADRCVTSSCDKHDATNWPDIPWDQECSGDSCGTRFSPTFWSKKRLSVVTTKVWDTTRKTPGWQDVESWTFTHSFPSLGDDSNHAGLWLDRIVHAGLVGTKVTMPPVSFLPVSLPNRVLTQNTTTSNWHRIDQIVTEAGAKIDIEWDQPQCKASNLPADEWSNTMRCYPIMVTDPDDPTEKKVVPEWWHKHRVKSISESDLPTWSAGHQAPPKFTTFEYVGAPAWHYADDDGLTKKNRKTWSQFRGYATVKTRVGEDPGRQTLTVTDYLRGMHGDRLRPSGGTREVEAPASIGSETVYDEDQFAGMPREQTVYNGDETKPVSRTVTVPWRSEATAARTINGDTVTARFVETQVTYASTALGVDGKRGWRTTRQQAWFSDDYGTLEKQQDDGEYGKAGDEKCVVNTYHRNLDRNLVELVKQATTTALPCGAKATDPDDVVGDVRSYYGSDNLNAVPVTGAVTRTEELADWSVTTGTSWRTAQRASYDKFGRARTATDLKGNVTKTDYQPDNGGPVTAKVVTSPLNWTTTSTLEPYWGNPIKVSDQNGRVTQVAMDALGRTWRVWSPGWSYAGHEESPSVEYTYHFAPERDAYPYTRTRTLNAGGGYLESLSILDSLMRERQTQRAGVGGNRVVTDTVYDKLGRVATTYPAHAEPGAPSGELWWEPEWSVPAINRTVYDNANRATDQIFLATDGTENLVEKWRTVTRDEGDLVRTTPPGGGTPTTTLVDALGRTSELRQHTGPDGVDGPYWSTKYRYNARGAMTSVVDHRNNEWTYDYDARGRTVGVTDPDKGRSTSWYNQFDELEKTTDARGEAIWYVYDAIGRRSELRDDSATGELRAKWKYDTLYTGGSAGAAGQLTESYRYERRADGGTDIHKWQAGGFTERNQPTNVNYVVPDGSGASTTWSLGFGYSPYEGSPTSVLYPAAGSLPAETVTTTYDAVTGLPSQLKTTAVGVGTYVTSQQYTAYGEPTITTRLTTGGLAVEEGTYYDLTTRRVEHQSVKPASATGTVADRSFEYDADGTIESITDKPQAGPADTQCFRYDALRRLTSAWTPKAEVGCEPDPVAGNLGGPAPYWLGWTIDPIGNRTEQVDHTASADVTRTYAVPASGPQSVRPHAVDTVTTGATDGRPAVVNAYRYDNSGNTVCRPGGAAANDCATGAGSQRLEWDAEGRLATVTAAGAVVESSVYDPDGTRLVRRDSSGSTLYLPGQEIRRTTSGVLSGTRYYTFGGKVVGSRDGSGLSWLFSDHQGTQLAAIKADTQAVTVRRQLPYGGNRGPAQPWPNARGFVGGTNDPTGLVRLGAREYDAGLGRFISVDPVQDMDDPQQWNAYAYAGNNPVTKADPTGQIPEDMSGEEYARERLENYFENLNKEPARKAPRVKNTKLGGYLRSIYLRPGTQRWRGNGKLGIAIRLEILSGRPTYQKWHYEKGANVFKGLAELLDEDRKATMNGRPPLLSPRDRQIAMDEARELWSSLNEEDKGNKFERAIKSTAQGRESLRNAKVRIADAGKYQAVKEITGAQFRPRTYNGRVVGVDRTAGPRLTGVAKMLSVVGDAWFLYQFGKALTSDEPAAELNELQCQMIYALCQHAGQMKNGNGWWFRDEDGNYSYSPMI